MNAVTRMPTDAAASAPESELSPKTTAASAATVTTPPPNRRTGRERSGRAVAITATHAAIRTGGNVASPKTSNGFSPDQEPFTTLSTSSLTPITRPRATRRVSPSARRLVANAITINARANTGASTYATRQSASSQSSNDRSESVAVASPASSLLAIRLATSSPTAPKTKRTASAARRCRGSSPRDA